MKADVSVTFSNGFQTVLILVLEAQSETWNSQIWHKLQDTKGVLKTLERVFAKWWEFIWTLINARLWFLATCGSGEALDTSNSGRCHRLRIHSGTSSMLWLLLGTPTCMPFSSEVIVSWQARRIASSGRLSSPAASSCMRVSPWKWACVQYM